MTSPHPHSDLDLVAGTRPPFGQRLLAAAIAALALAAAAVQAGDAWGQTIEPAPAAASASAPATAGALRVTSARLSADDGEGLPRLNELAKVLQVSPVLRVDGGVSDLPPGADVMTLQRVVGMSLPVNLDVRAAGYRAESFAQTRNAALGALLPHVDIHYDNGKGRLESADPYDTLKRKDGSVVASQVLFDEVARREWQRQGVLAGSSKVQFDGTRSSASLEIAGAYLQVLQSRLTIELSQEYETLLAELLRVVTERANGGGASGADRERVRGRVANARATIADARAALQVARRNLERLMGTPIDSVSVILPPGLIVPGGLAGAKALALEQNPDLVSARADLEAADYERLGYASRFTPRVSVELTHSRNINAAGTESYYRETKAMVVVTLPLVNGGTDYAQTRAAVARREEQRARAENVERKLVQELDAAYVNLDATRERYASMLEEIASNRSVVAAFKDQLTASNRSLLDVLDAYQRFHQSRLDVTQLLVGETQNRLRVAHLSGILLGAIGAGPAQLPH